MQFAVAHGFLSRIDANRIVSYYDFDGRGNPIRKVPGVSFDTADDEDLLKRFESFVAVIQIHVPCI